MSFRDELGKIKFDHTDFVDGFNTLCDKDIDQIIELVKKGLIGEDQYHQEDERVVSTEEGRRFAEGCCGLCLTDAPECCACNETCSQEGGSK